MDFLLIFAGFDPSSFAGLGSDIITSFANSVHPLAVMTANTLQVSGSFKDYQSIDTAFAAEQFDELIVKYHPHTIKAGMLGDIKMAELLLSKIEQYSLKLILDPVLNASAGKSLIDEKGFDFLKKELIPRAYLWTPNIPEARKIINRKIDKQQDLAEELFNNFKSSVLLKGGHGKEDIITDFLVMADKVHSFSHEKRANIDSHGSGCRLSAAVAAGVARGKPLEKSVSDALKWIEQSFVSPYSNDNNKILSFGGDKINFTLDYK